MQNPQLEANVGGTGAFGSYPLDKFTSRRSQRREPISLEQLSSRVPPHSNEAEMAVISAMMLDRAATSKAIELLETESFYRESHKKIFETMCMMFNRNMEVDIVTLSDELEKRGILEQVGGPYYLAEISNKVATAAMIEHHSLIVDERSLKRQLIRTAGEILENCYDDTTDALDVIDKSELQIFDIAEKRHKRGFLEMKSLAHDTLTLITQLAERDGTHSLTGVATGFHKLDEMLGGFQRSDLIIIAGRPSMGKTAFALSIARNAAVEFNAAVGIFSIEMAANQLMMRLLSAESRINAHHIRTGRIKHSDMAKIVNTMGRLAEAPIYIDDSADLSVMEIRAKVRRLVKEKNCQMIVVDYLQLVTPPKAESREREISIISRSLKQLAKELDIPVVALAQLNRGVEARADKRPMLSDLRESGSIEQDADVVMFVHRPEMFNIHQWPDDGTDTTGQGEIIIGKQRNGPVGEVRLAYLKDFARFENLEVRFDEPSNPRIGNVNYSDDDFPM